MRLQQKNPRINHEGRAFGPFGADDASLASAFPAPTDARQCVVVVE